MHTIALAEDGKIATWSVNGNGALRRNSKWDGGLRDRRWRRWPAETRPTPVPRTATPLGRSSSKSLPAIAAASRSRILVSYMGGARLGLVHQSLIAEGADVPCRFLMVIREEPRGQACRRQLTSCSVRSKYFAYPGLDMHTAEKTAALITKSPLSCRHPAGRPPTRGLSPKVEPYTPPSRTCSQPHYPVLYR